MACVCIDNGLIEFPSSLTCILKDGYKVELKQKNKYLGGNSISVPHKIEAKVIFTNSTDLSIFAHWWLTELDYGYLPFKLTVPIFGKTDTWDVRLTNDLSEAINSGIVKEISLDMEFIESSVLDLYNGLTYIDGANFPTSLTCRVFDTFTSTIPRKNRYLGMNSVAFNNPTVDVDVILETNNDAIEFMSWWLVGLDYGTATITLEMPVMGVTRVWTARLVGSISETISGISIRKISLKLELLEEITALIESGASANLCAIC